MIKIGSKVNVHFNLRMLRNLRILYLPRQTNDCWIFKNEKGEEIIVEFGYLFFTTQRDKILFKCSPDYRIIHIKTAKDWLDFKNKKEDKEDEADI